MAGGIKIAFAADVRSFLAGAGDVTEALDDVSDALDDLATTDAGSRLGDDLRQVGDDAKDAGRDIERHIEDGTKDAGESVERLEKKFRDLSQTAKTEAKQTGDAVGKDVRRGTDEASEGLDNLKDESGETAREVGASFDGSLDSIAEGFQEVAANAFVGFGPAGMVAGLGIAAGIGIGISALQKTAEEAAETKQRIIDLADSIREAGGDIAAIDWGEQFREFGNEIADAKSWFEPWQEASKTNFEALRDDAERFGLDYRSLFQGMAGDTDQATDALKEVNAAIEASEDRLAQMEEATDRASIAQRNARSEERGRADDLRDLRDRLQDASGVTEEAIEYERLMEDAYRGSAAELQDKNEELREHAELTAEVVTSELDWLDTLEETTKKLAENAAAGFDKNTAAGRENLRALNDVAQAALSYADATEESTGSVAAANVKIEEGRQKVIDAGKALGMTEDQAREYATALGLIPREVSTTAKAQTSGAETALEAVARRREAAIVAMAQTEHAQIALNRLAQKTVFVDVRPVVGVQRIV